MYSEASGLSMSAMARPTSRRFRSPVTIPRRHRLSLSCSRHGYRPCSLHMNRNVGTISVDQPVIIHETRTLPTVAITELAVSQLNLAISALLADPPSTNSGIIRLEQSFQRLSENVLKKIEAANWPSDDYISNSEDTSEIIWKAKLIKKPKKGIMEIIWRLKFEEFSHLHFFQMEILWPKTTRLRSSEVPIKEKAAAIDWLHAQHHLPCYYFSGRGQNREQDLIRISGNEHGGCHDKDEKCFVSVAGVGSAVSFRGSDPFSLEDWKCIKRFLSKDCPLVRAYGAIRFDAKRNISTEWKEFGSFYFIVPQVEFDEFEDGSMLATTIAWDDSLLLTWEEAVNGLLATMNQLSVRFDKLEKSIQRTAIVGCSHVPSKASWNDSVTKALETINRRHSDLVKVVLARCSRYVTDSVIDPLALLASLQVEGQNAYQFYIQPSNAPAFIGNTPEKLFHRKFLSISSEALAGTRARGVTKIQDFQNGQDLFYSRKDDMEFSIVRDSIRGKLETICNEVIVDPRKGLRKLPRVQHLCAELFGKLRRECDEFYALTSLHPSPAVCGMPSEEARKFIEEHEKFDRGMYAGPVGWFGGSESEFAVGIRSALVGQDLNTLVFAGAGIVEGTVPSLEWEEVDLKISQFTNALHSKHV